MIGGFSVINIGSTICHHSAIGKNVIICPKVLVSGKCKLKDNIFVGNGTIINPKIEIENNVIIGSMSNVLKNISKKGVYFGNPVKKLINKFMCGLAGVFTKYNFETKKIKNIVSEMATRLKHRGPDSNGIYTTNKFSVGFQRLSILDTSVKQTNLSQIRKKIIFWRSMEKSITI